MPIARQLQSDGRSLVGEFEKRRLTDDRRKRVNHGLMSNVIKSLLTLDEEFGRNPEIL